MPKPDAPKLDAFISAKRLASLIELAREEDLGPDGLDVTSELFVSNDLSAEAHVVAREAGRLSGLSLLPRIAKAYDERLRVTLRAQDGDTVQPEQSVAHLSGPMRSILTVERVALNLLSHLSGIATLTSRFVAQTQATRAKVYDTRKTLPGLRGLQKYAVACGGGGTHRMGLYDAVLLKDNHLANVGTKDLALVVADAVKRSRAAYPGLKFVMIEVDTIDQLKKILTTGIDIVLLDNMETEQLKQAVELRNGLAPKVELEASGVVTLETVRAISKTGVDRISIGALTHSAPAMDFGLDIRP